MFLRHVARILNEVCGGLLDHNRLYHETGPHTTAGQEGLHLVDPKSFVDARILRKPPDVLSVNLRPGYETISSRFLIKAAVSNTLVRISAFCPVVRTKKGCTRNIITASRM